MDEIDLEITNYSNKDIEYFFRLDEIPNYTSDDINQHVYEVQTENNLPKFINNCSIFKFPL